MKTNSGGKEPGRVEFTPYHLSRLKRINTHLHEAAYSYLGLTHEERVSYFSDELKRLGHLISELGGANTPQPEPPQGELYRASINKQMVDAAHAIVAQREQAAYQRGREARLPRLLKNR